MPDDYTPRGYQEDLDDERDTTDPVMDEQNEDITEELNIPEDEMRDELDKLDSDTDDDDARENVEDLDEDDEEAE